MVKLFSLSTVVDQFIAAYKAEMASVEIATSSIYGDHGNQFESSVKNFIGHETTTDAMLMKLSNYAETGDALRVLNAVVNLFNLWHKVAE